MRDLPARGHGDSDGRAAPAGRRQLERAADGRGTLAHRLQPEARPAERRRRVRIEPPAVVGDLDLQAVAREVQAYRRVLRARLEARDPEVRCYLPGVPRAMYMPYPFQIVQSANKIQIAFAFSIATRTIHLDEVEGPPDLTYMGHSVGRWDGDTLVVDVTEFNGKNWLDRAGNYHSEALHLTERFTPISKDAIQYDVTIEDPNVFTRPWTISMPLYRRLEENAQLMEYRCIEFVEEFMYGGLRRKPLVTRWEGETMIVDIRRKVPEGDKLYEWYRR